ncbi:MAG: nucleotidyltransferase domain-containing protein [Desulfuromonadales bacterium]|nr:nucleotidyltransferase domain-containing protein [Desulfuromonadales bacterium]
MGNQKNKTRNISNALFTNTQQQVLRLLFGQPDKSFYSKELVDKAGIGTGTVHRELGKLSGAGLLTVKNIGNQKHYQANPDSPIYEELKGIVRKTFGISKLLYEVLAPHQNSIRLAFIYGSVAKGSDSTTSDIDLMLISDKITYPDLLVSFADLENELGKKISPTIYSVEEFRNKRDSKNSFVTRVINQPKIILIGSENDIETM